MICRIQGLNGNIVNDSLYKDGDRTIEYVLTALYDKGYKIVSHVCVYEDGDLHEVIIMEQE